MLCAFSLSIRSHIQVQHTRCTNARITRLLFQTTVADILLTRSISCDRQARWIWITMSRISTELSQRCRCTRRAVMSKRRRGAATVELAVVAPVLFLLVFTLFEFGRMVMVQQALTNAAREGCRVATLATTTSSLDAETAVRHYLQSVIPNAGNASTVAVNVNPSGLTGITPGTQITIDTSVSLADVSWLPNNFLNLDRSLILRGRSTQRRE